MPGLTRTLLFRTHHQGILTRNHPFQPRFFLQLRQWHDRSKMHRQYSIQSGWNWLMVTARKGHNIRFSRLLLGKTIMIINIFQTMFEIDLPHQLTNGWVPFVLIRWYYGMDDSKEWITIQNRWQYGTDDSKEGMTASGKSNAVLLCLMSP